MKLSDSISYYKLKDTFISKGYIVIGDARLTPLEMKFGLASNVTLARYKQMTRPKRRD